MIPMPTQISGAEFLAGRSTALLADEPRVGKTGAALLAVELLQIKNLLIVTTASGRAVWRRATREWIGREAEVVGVDKTPRSIKIVSWDQIRQAKVYAALIGVPFDAAILDEDHRAKNPDTKTAQAIYGRFNKHGDRVAKGLATDIPRVWHLSGTPLPHDPGDTWCRLRSSAPDVLRAHDEFPNVITYEAFRQRYCVIRMKKISNFNSIPVVIGGRNLPELRARMSGWMLRRTQKDIGIRPSVQELMPLIVPPSQRREIVGDEAAILEAIENGTTKQLEMELGPLRRITGRLKAEAVVIAAKEWLGDNPGEKLVLAYYHREVGDVLAEGLSEFGVCRVDGATAPEERDYQQTLFISDPLRRPFLAQIEAAGEAIDLSAAAELWFVESTFSPKSMKQMSHRISNVNQTKPTFVRVCYIENSIDEAIQASLLRLWSAIKEVTHDQN